MPTVQIKTYTLPYFWSSYLVNGDHSGMDDSELKGILEWLAQFDAPHHCVDVSEQSQFCWRHDAINYAKACSCYVYTFEISGN
ncbi:MAG: hypothetical protein KDG50_06905 [Chromatiales bacterium]|nr:hypothetical protein [Chromatiales bacterium]